MPIRRDLFPSDYYFVNGVNLVDESNNTQKRLNQNNMSERFLEKQRNNDIINICKKWVNNKMIT